MPRADPNHQRIEQLGPLVRAILMRKSGMSLAGDDARHDNVEAIELVQEVLARLWERVAGDGAAAVDDLRAYAATITHNAWSEHLRRKHPLRTSLKNRLRYFLDHQSAYAMWNSAEGDPLGGRHGWQLRAMTPAPAERVNALRSGREKLPPGSVPRKAMDRFTATDWDRLVGAILDHFGSPVAVDDLVAIAAERMGLQEDRTESLDGDDADEGDGIDLAEDTYRGPERQAETRGLLRQLWGAVLALKPDYRRAYLLNLPGPGKSRADLEVFVMHAVATLSDIDAALGLSEAQYRDLLAELPLDPGERQEAERCRGTAEFFCLLWRHLPLSDALIGRLLGLEQQQVINRRMLAMRELARLIGHRPRR